MPIEIKKFQHINFPFCFFTARKRSLRRLCFHRCLSVHRGVSASGPGGCVCHYPPRQTPPVQTPPARHPPGRHPLGRHPSCPVHAGIQTPSCSVHSGIHPPPSECWDMVNKRAICIKLECILVSQICFEM